ncbi:helicase C-terminal domain-containing protein [Streptomyces sp. NPDC047108]|uniref:helicase C-terminal domain-containing protein n=1 Tax=Streptomyces sp. NPDC047108 TaxID=3155025 RepID=UPI0033E65FDE
MPTEPRRDSGRGASAAPRTLAEELRARPDEDLAALLRARPDLLSPVPGDLTQLATRAGTRASVVRALERLDRFALQTAEALAVAPAPCTYDVLLGLMAGDADGPVDATAPEGTGDADSAGRTNSTGEADVEDIVRALPRAVAALRTQALLWGGDDRLHLVRTAREVLAPGTPSGAVGGTAGPSPTGLGPTVAEATSGMSPGRLQEIIATCGLPATHDPVTAVGALAALFRERERMTALLAQAPQESGEILARLVWGPPYGTVPAQPSAPVRWLTDRGLLLPTAPGTVVLPREVALHLRAGRAHRTPEPVAPAVGSAAVHRPGIVDATAAGQALTAVGTVEDLLKEWDLGGPAVLRAGGLSVRDLKRTATALDTDEPTAAFWVELAYAAGLVASDGEADERFAPTPAGDEWLGLPTERRWAALVAPWLSATRTAGTVGGQDAKGRSLSALGPGLDRTPAPHVRHRVLELLSHLPGGHAAAPATLLARLRWEHGAPAEGAGATGAAARGASGTATNGARSSAANPSSTGPATSPAARARYAASRIAAAEQPTPSLTATGAAAPDDLRSRLARWTLAEAELLGVTGRGALSTHGRALLGDAAAAAPVTADAVPHQDGAGTRDGSKARKGTQAGNDTPAREAVRAPDGGDAADTVRTPPPTPDAAATSAARAAALLAPLLPEPLDHVLLQADLTAVAPGPLERPLAAMLEVLADVESKGGATVYRFTPGSVRRALDAGQAAADLHAFLAQHSRTPVPQPLSYLIDDVARKHGHLRVGAAFAYVRCDDDALLAEILADRRASGLRLRRLAPTVLAAQATPDVLLERLRGMGYAPAAESEEGDVVVARADAYRTPPRTAPVPVQGGPPLPDATLLGAAVKAIRAGDLAATAVTRPVAAAAGAGPGAAAGGGTAGPASGRAAGRPASGDGGLPRTTSAETLATMQAAALTSSAVWIGYVNADGAASQRVIAPVRVEGGYVTAYDHTADEVRTFPLHRITGVAELADGPA